MRKYFFDMKDGVPFRDRIGMDFNGNLEAIAHCKAIRRHRSRIKAQWADEMSGQKK